MVELKASVGAKGSTKYETKSGLKSADVVSSQLLLGKKRTAAADETFAAYSPKYNERPNSRSSQQATKP